MFGVIWSVLTLIALIWLLFTWPMWTLIGGVALVGCMLLLVTWQENREDQRYIDMQFRKNGVDRPNRR